MIYKMLEEESERSHEKMKRHRQTDTNLCVRARSAIHTVSQNQQRRVSTETALKANRKESVQRQL